MSNASILIAGIGNIFQGDDAFGVTVAQRIAAEQLPPSVRLMHVGIRAIDLGFALLDNYELVILVDATSRGGAPGTLYTIEIRPGDIPDSSEDLSAVNSHSLDPVRVLALAKTMGARFGKVLLVGCEPLVTDHDESGHIGLSTIVEAAVAAAIATIRELIEDFELSLERKEVCFHESV